jgi:hypothetical protein
MRVRLRDVVETHPALKNNLLVLKALIDTLSANFGTYGMNLDDTVDDSYAGVLWIYAYVLSCEVLTERPLLTLIGVYRKELVRYAEECAKALRENPDSDLRPLLLGVANREVASLSNVPGWYDLRNATPTTTRPAVFEGISYNLAYPIKIEWLRLQEQERAKSTVSPST